VVAEFGVFGEVLGHSAGATTLGSGAVEYIMSGGTATSTTAVSGSMNVYSGGLSISATVDSTGIANIYGVASALTVDGTEDVSVYAGGSVVSAQVNDAGTLRISAGAAATGTYLNLSSYLNVSSGGAVTGTQIGNEALEEVNGGGTATSDVVGFAGSQYICSGGLATDTVISSGGYQFVASSGSATSTSVESGGFMVVSGGAVVSDTILHEGGTIDLAQFAFSAVGTASFDYDTDVLTVTEGGSSTTLQLSGDYSGEYFHLTADANSGNDETPGTDITVDGTPCYCAGTLILTDRGEVAVEDLAIGDRVMVRSGAARPIKWIGQRSYSGVFALRNREILPIIIRQGALDGALPRRDLHVSPLHALFIDGVLIPACALVNGVSIVQPNRVTRVDYYHVELETHDVIFAEGAAAESFVDDDSRGMFHNAAEYRRLYPGRAPRQPVYCAPMVQDGAELEIVRLRLTGLAPHRAA
jgi:autotransporter passenger strand-loop-strand repeat protein